MKFKVHYTVNCLYDSIDITGEDTDDCRKQWDDFSKGKPFSNMWSELIKETP